MRTLLMLLACLAPTVVAGCRSSATQAPVPTAEAPTALPEIRYYVIADT